MKCYCKFNDIDVNAMTLLVNEWIETSAAKSGDQVLYQSKSFKVVSTDFSMERFKKRFRATYSYILIGEKGEQRLKDLEYPLRKLGYGKE